MDNIENNLDKKAKKRKSSKAAIFLVVSVVIYFGLLFGIAKFAPNTPSTPVLILLIPLVPGAFVIGVIIDVIEYLNKK